MEMDDGDDANWIEDEPSRMNEDHAEDDDDDDDDDDDGAPTAGPSASSGMPSGFSNPFTGGFGGMDIDADTAAAIFGGGFRAFGGGGSAISNRLRRLRNDLKSPKTATRLQALQECSEILLVATEDTLAGHFNIEGFSKEFIAILDGKPNVAGGASIENDAGDEDAQLAAALAMSSGEEMPGFGGDAEAQLVACRCLAHLLEALPGTGHVLVHLGAVRVLCSKLKEISYIELAEQTLSVSYLPPYSN
jgi:E3 ubiquitin-protein ligase TRIP12